MQNNFSDETIQNIRLVVFNILTGREPPVQTDHLYRSNVFSTKKCSLSPVLRRIRVSTGTRLSYPVRPCISSFYRCQWPENWSILLLIITVRPNHKKKMHSVRVCEFQRLALNMTTGSRNTFTRTKCVILWLGFKTSHIVFICYSYLRLIKLFLYTWYNFEV